MGEDPVTPQIVRDRALYIIDGIKSIPAEHQKETVREFIQSLNRTDLEVFAACCLLVVHRAASMEIPHDSR